MRLPGFTAEASLYQTSVRLRKSYEASVREGIATLYHREFQVMPQANCYHRDRYYSPGDTVCRPSNVIPGECYWYSCYSDGQWRIISPTRCNCP
jgi:hypothetical protein